MKILLIDDESELVETLSERLSIRGIETAWATNGEQGLAILGDKDFDCVIMDLKMPGLDGENLVEAIRKLKPKIRIILATGVGNTVELNSCMSAGADSCIMKPFDLEDLLTMLTQKGGNQ